MGRLFENLEAVFRCRPKPDYFKEQKFDRHFVKNYEKFNICYTLQCII